MTASSVSETPPYDTKTLFSISPLPKSVLVSQPTVRADQSELSRRLPRHPCHAARFGLVRASICIRTRPITLEHWRNLDKVSLPRRWSSQVVRHGSAKAAFIGLIRISASILASSAQLRYLFHE